MTPTPESLTRQWFQEVWNDRDEGAIDRLLSPDAIVHGLGGSAEAPMRGPDAFKAVFRTFHGAIEGLAVTVQRTYECGDTCVAWCRVQGKHNGSAFGGAPTGRDVDFEGVTIIRARDGRLVEGWNVFDFLKMYQQIGWVPNPVLPSA